MKETNARFEIRYDAKCSAGVSLGIFDSTTNKELAFIASSLAQVVKAYTNFSCHHEASYKMSSMERAGRHYMQGNAIKFADT